MNLNYGRGSGEYEKPNLVNKVCVLFILCILSCLTRTYNRFPRVGPIQGEVLDKKGD